METAFDCTVPAPNWIPPLSKPLSEKILETKPEPVTNAHADVPLECYEAGHPP